MQATSVITFDSLNAQLRAAGIIGPLNHELLAELINSYCAIRNGRSPLHCAVTLLEHAADKFNRDGLLKTSSGYLRVTAEMRSLLGVPRPGASLNEKLPPELLERQQDTAGRELQVQIERAAREVVRRELAIGGLIWRELHHLENKTLQADLSIVGHRKGGEL
ncbi:hypothetical protein [Pseudomonas aeruginosa]|uniref:hypothetical protein n=1 Tax=Pseudomonas aeruginosa TaxID=287 RepID=UPI00053D51C9|nr:hypothetical protein [Pseudomonas aeruginosa]MBG4026748.1 hypothetical protein [Pseudomonas aeruginosa]MBG6484155.1 hypothetical protein [Pseudomonas aeruginosa]MBI7766196.1 hypothetical protein [Pseudomonas aeruginosa]MDG3876479.1 hypothetical protein [Pseudomonas aeruginosa]RWX84003.1 hypothetical protein EQH78_20530 [Pseudomonas aeruginosa]